MIVTTWAKGRKGERAKGRKGERAKGVYVYEKKDYIIKRIRSTALKTIPIGVLLNKLQIMDILVHGFKNLQEGKLILRLNMQHIFGL